MGVIFVAGVHAVGKTTACTRAAASLGLVHYAASSLIEAERAGAIPKQGKVVPDVNRNQELLICGVEKARERHQGRIILDGHFTLSKPDGKIEAVALDVFRAIVLDGVVVFQDNPEDIAMRLELRDGEARNPDAIALHQNAELTHAHVVSRELSVPLKILSAFDIDGLTCTIADWNVTPE